MRRFKTAVALLLTCILILPCCVAHGVECYTILRDLFSGNKDAEWYLGEGTIKPWEATGKDIIVVYKTEEKKFYILGVNESGEGECILWEDTDAAHGVLALYRICFLWDDLQQILKLDEGYTLSLALAGSQESGKGWLIRDAESAAEYIAKLEEIIGSIQQKENLPESEKQGE